MLTRFITSALSFSLLIPCHSESAILLLDRGLPVDNVNAGHPSETVERSNVTWGWPNDQHRAFIPGDTITNPSTDDWQITSISVWTIGNANPSSTILWGNIANETSIHEIASSPTVTQTTYQNSEDYWVSGSRAWRSLHQLDFEVDFTLYAGQSYQFYLQGGYLHASNAALSGSPQEGADNLGKVAIFDATSNSYTTMDYDYTPGFGSAIIPGGKSSDFNVQVFGLVIPEPSVVQFAVLGGILSAFRRRRHHSGGSA